MFRPDQAVSLYTREFVPIVPASPPVGGLRLSMERMVGSCPDDLVRDEDCWRTVLSKVATLRGLWHHRKAHLISRLTSVSPAGQTLFSEILEGVYDSWEEPKVPLMDAAAVCRGQVPVDWLLEPRDGVGFSVDRFLQAMRSSSSGLAAFRWLIWRSWAHRDALEEFHVIARNRAFIRLIPSILQRPNPSTLEVWK